MKRTKLSLGMTVLIVLIASSAFQIARDDLAAEEQSSEAGVPMFEVDPLWPKMEGNWIFGSIGGIAVDPTNDHVFVLNRPRSIARDEDFATKEPPVAECCVPAKSVLEFDPAGNLIQEWGGPNPGAGYEWPESEHGITIDHEGNVWIGGNARKNTEQGTVGDAQFLKFTRAGEFLLQIGHQGMSGGSQDTENLGSATEASVFPETNEVFIADGYGNRRVIVFDADSGAYKRHWGAYGNKPDDEASLERLFEGPPPQQFNTVHSVLISNDGLVYVGDRANNRIQVFKPDGTFVKEGFVARKTLHGSGTTCDLAMSPDKEQKFLYVTDPGNHHVWILNRDTLEVVGDFGRLGHQTGQFYHLHVLAVDTKGNIYTGENTGKRVQKWLFKGFSS